MYFVWTPGKWWTIRLKFGTFNPGGKLKYLTQRLPERDMTFDEVWTLLTEVRSRVPETYRGTSKFRFANNGYDSVVIIIWKEE